MKTEASHDQAEAELQRLRLFGNPKYLRLDRLQAQINAQLEAGWISADVANEASRALAGKTLALIAEVAPEIYRASRADRSWEAWSDYSSGADQDTNESDDAKEARRKQALDIVEAFEANRAQLAGEISQEEAVERVRPAFPQEVRQAEIEHFAADPSFDPREAEQEAPLDLDSPQVQAYVAAREAEATHELGHTVVADTPTINQEP